MGGAFTVTLGLEKEFPDRMLNTPIAELGFFGEGSARRSWDAADRRRPVRDFLFLAMDQIVNNAAKLRYMSGGTVKVPLVMRAPVGDRPGITTRTEHGALLHGCSWPQGRRRVQAYDAKGLLKAAVRDDNPVLIFEHKLL